MSSKSIKIEDATLTVQKLWETRQEAAYRWRVATDSFSEESDDLRLRGPQRGVEKAMGVFLSFLGAAAEAQDGVKRRGWSDNADLFSPEVMQWALDHSMEIESAAIDLDPGMEL